MRIVYLINGLNGGGAAFPMVRIVGLMQELGHDVTVTALMLQDGKALPRLDDAGIPHEVVGKGRRDFIAPALRLIHRLRRRRPDLIWTSLTRGTVYGQLVGRLLDIPVVSWQHSAYLKPANLAILRRTAGLTKHWVADSESVRQFAASSLHIDFDKITVWPPFIADSRSPVAAPWPGRGPLRLGTLGRLHHSKQYEVLLRAFARARSLGGHAGSRLELQIAGDGPEQAALESLAAGLALGGTVRFVGFVEHPAEFLAGLHGYVQTSLKEGFCIAAHEAMQAGLPVIATRVGELVHSVRPGETGWLCEVGDVEALAQAMLALAGDPAGAAAMGRAGRAGVLDRYAPERFRAVGERLLDDLGHAVAARLPAEDATRPAASARR